MRPDVPIGTGDLAKLLGWQTRRAARWVDALARQDPTIIHREGRYRRFTLAALRRVSPELARRFASDQDVEELRDEQKEQQMEIQLIARRLREFQQESEDWHRKLAARMNATEKALRERQKNGQPAPRTAKKADRR